MINPFIHEYRFIKKFIGFTKLLKLFFIAILGGISEIIWLASMYFFIKTISSMSFIKDTSVENNFIDEIFINFVNYFSEFFSINERSIAFLIIFMGLLFTTLIRVFVTYFTYLFSYLISAQISMKIVNLFLNSNFYKSSRGNFLDLVTNKSLMIADRFTVPLINIIIALVSGLFMVIGLTFVIGYEIILALLFASFFILLSSFLIGPLVSSKSKVIVDQSPEVMARATEIYESSDLIKTYGINRNFIMSFNRHLSKLRTTEAELTSITLIPRYLLDLILILIIFTLYLFIINSPNFNQIVFYEKIIILIIAMIRIAPITTRLFSSYITISSSRKSNYEILSFISKAFRKKQKNKSPLVKGNIIINDKLFLNDFRISFNQKRVLKIDSQSFDNKFFYYIYGESGIGKSTFFKALSGIHDNSIIKFNNKIIPKNKINTNFILVFQKPIFFDGSILENINGENLNKEELNSLISICELKDVFKSYKDLNKKIRFDGKPFSGGECQRISLMRALSKQRKVLLIDEGLSGLSISLEKKILKNIREKHPNLIIIIISHRKIIDDQKNKIIIL